MEFDKDLQARQEARQLLRRAEDAQKQLGRFSQEKLDAIVKAIAAAIYGAATELADIKCAVSEAVTNCIVHAYGGRGGICYITVVLLEGRRVRISVRDNGCGIADVRRAREPLFTTGDADERSGMGFTVMENFMDRLTVRSRVGRGTLVLMSKELGRSRQGA